MLTTHHFETRVVFAVLFLILLSLSCEIPIFSEARDKARLKKMRNEIMTLAGDPICQKENDCSFLPLGSKPCGGPREYLIFSKSQVDSALLAAKVAEYNQFEREMNRKYGYVSDCSVPTPPELGCVDGRCVDLNKYR